MSVFYPYINFSLFAFGLFYFLRKPVSGFLLERQNKIADRIKASKHEQETAERLLNEVNSRLNVYDAETEKRRNEILSSVKEEANKIILEGEEIANRKMKDLERLKEESLKKFKERLSNDLASEAKKILISKISSDFSADSDAAFIKSQIDKVDQVVSRSQT